MTDLERLSAEIEALKQRVALLEANASQKLRMVYNWHLREPAWRGPSDAQIARMVNDAMDAIPVYEHYIDPAMRMTRNG